MPASLVGGREADLASLSRCGSLRFIIDFLSLPDCGPMHAAHAGAGQQPGPPPPEAIATAIEGGQLMAVRAPACAEATDAAVLTQPAARAGGPA